MTKMELLNPIAEMDTPDSGLIVSPERAYELKNNGHSFFCPDYNCKDPNRILFVKKSSKDTLFFCHKKGCDHPILPETLLHKSAVNWFLKKSEYEIPVNHIQGKEGLQKIDWEKTKLEFRQLEKHIPDVRLITTDGFEFAIEIFVTNDISNEKAKIISEFGLPTLRVDLSDFYNAHRNECRTNLKFIQQHLDFLMTDINRKMWVLPEDKNSISSKPYSSTLQDNQGCVFAFIVLLFCFIVRYFKY